MSSRNSLYNAPTAEVSNQNTTRMGWGLPTCATEGAREGGAGAVTRLRDVVSTKRRTPRAHHSSNAPCQDRRQPTTGTSLYGALLKGHPFLGVTIQGPFRGRNKPLSGHFKPLLKLLLSNLKPLLSNFKSLTLSHLKPFKTGSRGFFVSFVVPQEGPWILSPDHFVGCEVKAR